MKRLSLFSIAAGLMLFGLSSVSYSHDGGGFLGDQQSATDLYLLTCSDDGSGAPDQLFFQLSNDSPAGGPILSAQLQVPDKRIAYSVTVPANASPRTSRGIDVRGGTSPYFLTVMKNGSGRVSYSFEYHCQTDNGTHTGTGIAQRQEQ